MMDLISNKFSGSPAHNREAILWLISVLVATLIDTLTENAICPQNKYANHFRRMLCHFY
jgi:hypothetical protein